MDFTHFNEDGKAHMVDVSEKNQTQRTATAFGKIKVSREIISSRQFFRLAAALTTISFEKTETDNNNPKVKIRNFFIAYLQNFLTNNKSLRFSRQFLKQDEYQK